MSILACSLLFICCNQGIDSRVVEIVYGTVAFVTLVKLFKGQINALKVNFTCKVRHINIYIV